MNRRIKIVIIIEILIILGLFLHVVRTPHMWLILLLAILFTFLANRSRVGVFRVISIIFWVISAMILFTAGWFWLAIIFPAIMCIIFWKNNPRNNQHSQASPLFWHSFDDEKENEEEFLTKANGDDVIDLDNMHFKPSGNTLSIKKSTGNTKIIVPHDVAVSLDVTVETGIVKIFDESPRINAGNIRYFSDHNGDAQKRVRIMLRVGTGNVEFVRG